MALEASHIRFAVNSKDTLQVKDLHKYISGVLYPDSRYVTNVKRNLTHPKSLLDVSYTDLDDFKKGIYAHVVYDKILEEYTRETIPDLFKNIGEFTGQDSEFWIRLTALKIMQDIKDVKELAIQTYLPYLDYVETPHGEDPAILKKYNTFFRELYSHPETYSIENCYATWKFLGISADIAVKLTERTEQFQKDPMIKEFIESVYKQTLAIWLQNYTR
jgi:hypothetical protein